jgi:pyridoxal phosphate enzyme (YggS family)
MSVASGLSDVRARIERATRAAGRPEGSVRLIAVSKLQTAEAVREAHQLGQRDFGENYVQELLEKAEALSDLLDLRWHLIGHLQRNKARKIAGIVNSVHSIDSAELVAELGKRATATAQERARRFGSDQARLQILIEVNIASEAQKGGVVRAALGTVLECVEKEPSLSLRGLMCVPPATDDPADARPYFDQLAALRREHGGATRLPELSMGMTSDLEQAIAAGATWVRVGTAIFGARSI